MPAVSQAQQRLMAIAKSDPSAVKPENRGVLKMSPSQLGDFASTKRTGLPKRLSPPARKGGFRYRSSNERGQ